MVAPRRSGLGRGLGALIPQGATADAGALRDVPLARIRANQFQPRRHFDEEALSALVDSIRVVGILQPVLLREVADGDYELIAGERRCRAARRAGLQTVPALVQPASDASSLEQALIENLHREDLNALEEAAAYKQLIEEFELTHDEVARRVGRSRAAVTNAVRLFQLPPSVQRRLRDRAISAGHARALLGTPDRELQEQLAQRAVDEGLSVRALEELVRAVARGEDAQWEAVSDPVGPLANGSLAPEAVNPASDEAASAVTDGADISSGNGGPEFSGAGEATAGFLPPVSALRPPGVLELEELLADHLNTRVRVEMGAKHGRVMVEFATLEDLERIYRLMIGPTA
jgi:ParB family chromosome partitioning protein